MNMIVYDFETILYDWLVVFQDIETKQFNAFHNDSEGLRAFMQERRDAVFIGFNSKAYDQWIMKACCLGWDNQQIKGLNDYLISGGRGWDVQGLSEFWFNNSDIMDDMQHGLSLKAIEGHLGMDIEESSISFDIDRPLTEAELKELVHYCKHDVEATAKLVELRKDYLNSKLQVGRMAGLSDEKSLSMTNAKLTAAFLGAKKPNKPRTDERQYVYPENLKREYVPQEVFDFFDRMYDPKVPDEDLFSSKLEIEIGGTPATVGYGGIHSAKAFYFSESTDSRLIRNFDVASYYPHLMTVNGYLSRNIPNPQIYAEMLERRIKAKKAGDKPLANALKLIANTTYGATLGSFNDLYDPLMGRSVCISGQLYLIELTEHLYREIPGLTVVQTNTDGIMVEFDKTQYSKVLEITNEWQKRTGFELEEDEVARICQKDVNGYIEVAADGSTKVKGGYVVRGISPAGAFNINNNAVIVAEAITEWFVHGTPPEDTINACDDPCKFQLIAKAGAKYKEAWHLVDGKKEPVQKVNRVFAAKDPRYGKLYKVKATDDSEAQIESLPEHCLINNHEINGSLGVNICNIDKSWYVNLAKKRINDFYGVKPEKNTRTTKGQERMDLTMAAPKAETKGMNLYKKLSAARVRFLEGGAKKSGKNMKMAYLFFELEDIVPTATRIFDDLGLVHFVRFTENEAFMTVVDSDNPESREVFSAPFTVISPILNQKGAEVTNEVQRLGASMTYMRRYLWMLAMDVVEADEMEARTGSDPAEKPASTPIPKPQEVAKLKPPATPQQRAEIKQELAAVDENADEMMLEALKNACRKLATCKKVDYTEQIVTISERTENFTKISKKDCEILIGRINQILEGEANG